MKPSPMPLPVEPGRQTLSRQRILDAALALADAEGLEALSMRRLGAALGVEAMSLYHHVPSKAALLDGLVSTVLARVPLPEELRREDWEETLRTAFCDFRRIMLAHRSVFPLVATRPVTDAGALHPVARGFALLHTAGFTPRQAASAWCVLLSYVFGYIDCEISGIGEGHRSPAMRRAVREQADPELAALQLSRAATEEWDDDAEFELGLGTIVAGLRTWLPDRAS